MSARNRELLALVPASLLLTAGFAAIFIQQSAELSDVSLTYGAGFLGLCLCGHFVIRVDAAPRGPVPVPARRGARLLRARRDLPDRRGARARAGAVVRRRARPVRGDDRVPARLPRARALPLHGRRRRACCCCCCRACPVIGQQVNGAYLGVGIGPISFQPAEFGKIAIVIFLAAYLRDTRQLLVQGSRRFLGVTIPPLKHFGPLLAVWGGAMVMLVFIRDLGSSLMFFGGFLALLYVATNRLSFVTIGLGLFGARRVVLRQHGRARAEPRSTRGATRSTRALYEEQGGSYQIAQSLFAQADGGLFGTGFGQALITQANGASILPAPQTDLIYAVITNELGLAGACGLLLVYLMVAERGFKIAMLAQDSFSKLLATGLTAVFALQVFVIVGGVTKVIPLTGVTLPFVSYGGSSIVANFVLLALLLLVSDRARRPAARAVNKPVLRLYGLVVVLFGVLVVFTSRWTVFEAEALRDERAQPARAAAGAEDPARHDPLGRRQGAGARGAPGGRDVRAPLPDRRAVRPRDRLLLHRRSAAPASSARATTS